MRYGESGSARPAVYLEEEAMQMILWYPVVMHLCEYFRRMEEFKAYEIVMGEQGKSGLKPVLRVLWHSEDEISTLGEGRITLQIEIEGRGEETNAALYYESQYKAQKVILSSMRDWRRRVTEELGAAVRLKTADICALGRQKGPAHTDRITLSVEWRKK